MIVSVSGFGYSGASGFVDLLQEYDDVQVLKKTNFEFQLIKAPDGLIDLYYSVVERHNFLSANAGIKRFLKMAKENQYFSPTKKSRKKFKVATKSFVNGLELISWKGRSAYDPVDLKPIFGKRCFLLFVKFLNKLFGLFGKKYCFPIKRKRYYSTINEKDFCLKTSKYIYKLMKLYGFDTDKTIVLDQLFDASDVELSLKLLNNSRMIIVDRDPRDIFLISNVFYKNNAGFMTSGGNVDDFIRSFIKCRLDTYKSDSVLRINFEDLVFKYKDTKHIIENFVGVSNIKQEFVYFNPELSIANVGLVYKLDKNKEDINRIENELKQYCYHFDDKDIETILNKRNATMFK